MSGGSYSQPDWDLIEYTSFDKVAHVLQGTDELSLIYGADHSRVKSITTRKGVMQTTYYAGNLYEEEYLPTGEVKQRNYIFAGGSAIAICEQSSATGETLRYLHKDHLGSIMAYSDKSGKLAQELSYDAWGRRRDYDTWTYALHIADFNAWQARGFTAHEHLDIFEMINMDGRMYDHVLGRFMSPDPFVQAPDFTQGLNWYIYCLNNPLSFTDPSGYSWLSDNWKSLTSAIVGIVVAIIPGGQGLGAAIIAGALGGAAAGLTGALLNGANLMQTVKATFTGAFWGAVSGGFNFLSADPNLAAKLFKHAFSNMWLEGVRGGNMKHGLLSGLASAAGGSAIDKYGHGMGRAMKVAANAVVGGTAEELGGGKFANGAITGAFNMLFNDLMHQEDPPKDRIEDVDTLDPLQRIRELQTIQIRNAQSEPGLNNVYPEFELIFLVKGLVNILASSVSKGGQIVYRAVNAAEKASINSSKSFVLKEGGTEVKYFAKTLEDAHWYGSKLYPEGYGVIRATVNSSVNVGKFWHPYVDIGAYAFPGNILPYVKPIIP